MKILAIDVGTGTQDILLYDTEKEVENSLVMVMPSPTVIVAGKIKEAGIKGHNIFLTGDVMGGGPSVRAIKSHMEKGYRVYATKQAALTVKDDLRKVRSMGVIIPENNTEILPDTKEIVLQDIDLKAMDTALGSFGIQVPEKVAVAVQDHGNSPDLSNRIFRFRIFERLIDNGGDFSQFAYSADNIPEEFTRMAAAVRSLTGKEAIFMDTGPAAIFGALLDPEARQPSIVINIGNGHTLGAIVNNNRIVALFEHHTSALDGRKLQEYIKNFAAGTLGFEEVYNDGGHGCYIREKTGSDNIRSIMVTGPKRAMLQEMEENERNPEIWSKLHFASPYGNMMLSGCYGLLTEYLKNRAER